MSEIRISREVVERAIAFLDQLGNNDREANRVELVADLQAALGAPDRCEQELSSGSVTDGVRSASVNGDEHPIDSVPYGWCLVPVKLTEPMRQAAQDAWWQASGAEMYWERIYAAMLDAAPQPWTSDDMAHRSGGLPQDHVGDITEMPSQEPARWPTNATEVRAFLSGHVAAERYARDDHQPHDDDTYTLSAHDLLGAIDWWADTCPPQQREPLTDEEIKAMWKFPRDLSWIDSIVRLARTVEAAHGIGVGK